MVPTPQPLTLSTGTTGTTHFCTTADRSLMVQPTTWELLRILQILLLQALHSAAARPTCLVACRPWLRTLPLRRDQRLWDSVIRDPALARSAIRFFPAGSAPRTFPQVS